MTAPADANKPLALAQTPPGPADSQTRTTWNMPGMPPADKSGPPGLNAAPTFTGLLRALGQRWFYAVTVAACAAFATVFGLLNFLPQYAAHARLEIASRAEAPLPGMNGWEDPGHHVVYKGNQAALIKSPLVLNAALNQVKDLVLVREQADPVGWLELALKTDFNLGPEILRLSLRGDRPEEVAKIVNAVVDAYMIEVDQRDKTRKQQRMEQLKENHRLAEEDLRKLRLALRAREEALKIEDKETASLKYQNAQAKLTTVGTNLLQVQLEQIKATEELKTFKTQEENLGSLPVPEAELDAALREDPRAKLIYEQLAKIQAVIQQIKALSQNPNSSQLQSYEAVEKGFLNSVSELREQRRPELEQRYQNKMKVEIKLGIIKTQEKMRFLKSQEDVLAAEVHRLTEEVVALSPNSRPRSSDVEAMRDNVLRKEAALAKLGEAVALEKIMPVGNRISMLQRAEVPTSRDLGRQLKVAGAAGVGMFALVLFGIAFLEFRTGKIIATQEVEKGLGLNVVGTVPALTPRVRKAIAQGTPAAADWQNQLNEAVDSIRTMLLHANRSEDLHVVMVTSAVGGEGKTSLASQLASSLARAWRKTLLVDADLRRPSAHKLFNLPQDPGFSEVLRGEVNPADAICPTPVSRLWFLPAGACDSHALQALAQDNVRALFDQWKKQYDFIIVDSCPVLPVVDSLLLAQHVDGVLFSILREVSRAPAVYAAQQRLSNLGIRTLGAVVLGAKNELGKLAYSYGN